MNRHRSVAEYTPGPFAGPQLLSHAEQLLEPFFNVSIVGLGVCDEQLRYQAVNHTLATMNGVPAEEHVGKTVRDILGQNATSIEKIMKRVLATGQPVCNVKISGKLSGRPEPGHWIGNYLPIKNGSGQAKQVVKVVIEVTEQRKLEQSLHALTRKLLRAQDEEQRRIARDLHDSINQYHAALKMNLVKLRRNNMDQVKRTRLLAQSVELLDHCMAETRTISYLLHPPLLDEMGFASATRWYAKGFAQRSGIKVHLNLPPKMDRLPVPIEIALFRVVQESLTNVHRHAHASTVRIEVERVHNDVTLKVQDDGGGIPAEVLGHLQETAGATGVGLASMNERVRELHGVLQLESKHGTTVRVRVPVSSALTCDSEEEALSTVASS